MHLTKYLNAFLRYMEISMAPRDKKVKMPIVLLLIVRDFFNLVHYINLSFSLQDRKTSLNISLLCFHP